MRKISEGESMSNTETVERENVATSKGKIDYHFLSIFIDVLRRNSAMFDKVAADMHMRGYNRDALEQTLEAVESHASRIVGAGGNNADNDAQTTGGVPQNEMPEHTDKSKDAMGHGSKYPEDRGHKSKR